jgi:peptidoglycan/LPS O-acetylase OafA/YrhL
MNLPKHLYSLDVFRGIASIAVVFWPWQHFFMKGAQHPQDFSRAEQPLYALFKPMYEHGNLAVPFFFQLSGFVFFWLYQEKVTSGACSGYQFAVLRFARLYPLHVLTLLLVVALQSLYARVIGGYFAYPWNDAYHFALQAVFMSHWGFERGDSFNAPIWSVSIEIGLYCLFFLYCLARLPNAVKLMTVLVGTALVIKLGLGGARWPPAILAFFLGGLTYGAVDTYLQYRSKCIDALIVFTAIASWLGVLTSEQLEYWLLTRGHDSLFFLFPITITCLVIAETRFPNFPRRAAWIGNLTYSSYLLHFPLQLIFVLFVFGLGYDEAVFRSSSTLVVFLLLLFTLSLLTYHRFERPFQDMLRTQLLPRRLGQPSDAPESASAAASATDSRPFRPGDR